MAFRDGDGGVNYFDPGHPLAIKASQQRAAVAQRKAMAPPPAAFYGQRQAHTMAEPFSQAEYAQRGIMPPSSAPAISAEQQRFNAGRDKALGPYQNPDTIFQPQVNPAYDPSAFADARAKSLAPPTNDELMAAHQVLVEKGLGTAAGPPKFLQTQIPGGLVGPPREAMAAAPARPMGVSATAPPAGTPTLDRLNQKFNQPLGPGPGLAAVAPRPPALKLAARPRAPQVRVPAPPNPQQAAAPNTGEVKDPLMASVEAGLQDSLAKGDRLGAIHHAAVLNDLRRGFTSDAHDKVQAYQNQLQASQAQARMAALQESETKAKVANLAAETKRLEQFNSMDPIERGFLSDESVPMAQRLANRDAYAQQRDFVGPPNINIAPSAYEAQRRLAAMMPDMGEIFKAENGNSISPDEVFNRAVTRGYLNRGLSDPTSELARNFVSFLRSSVGDDDALAGYAKPETASDLPYLSQWFGSDQANQRALQLAALLRGAGIKPSPSRPAVSPISTVPPMTFAGGLAGILGGGW